jgi:hypothetical protein
MSFGAQSKRSARTINALMTYRYCGEIDERTIDDERD